MGLLCLQNCSRIEYDKANRSYIRGPEKKFQCSTVMPTKSDSDIIFCLQLLRKT